MKIRKFYLKNGYLKESAYYLTINESNKVNFPDIIWFIFSNWNGNSRYDGRDFKEIKEILDGILC